MNLDCLPIGFLQWICFNYSSPDRFNYQNLCYYVGDVGDYWRTYNKSAIEDAIEIFKERSIEVTLLYKQHLKDRLSLIQEELRQLEEIELKMN